MTTGRISSYNLNQTLLRDTTRSQTDLYNLQNQLSSGLKSPDFAGLGALSQSFTDLESRMSRGQGYIDGSTVISGRLDVADNTLSSIIDTATSIRNLISLRRNSAVGDSVAYDTQLVGQWQSLVSQVNVSLEGRYIFSGSATNIPAVNADTFPELIVDGLPDTGYYQGSAEDVTARIDDNINLTYNVRADDPAFQKIFAGLAMARKFGATSGENTEMQKAYDLIAEGTEGLISLRAEVNANKVTVQQTSDRLQSQQLYWKGIKEGISNTDLVAVSTQVAVNQGILQASFQAFARISGLKLSDFLR